MTGACYENRKSDACDLDTESDDRLFVRSQSVVSRVVAGETLIVPVRGKVGDLGSIYSFNGTGSLIWMRLESPRTMGELVTAVAEEFEVERDRAEQDVQHFVREMFSVGLVEVSNFVPGTEGPVGREGLAAAGAR